jgi:hypothetical protein
MRKLTTEEFINRANKIHKNKYDYSKSVFKNIRTKVLIICPIHGEFMQTPKNHMNGQGCPQCGQKYAKEWSKNNHEHFKNESLKRFGNVYELPNLETLYENSHSKIIIKCNKCGNVFEKIACDHLTSPHGGCLHCYANKSNEEEEIINFIKEKIGINNIVTRDRKILNGRELDILIPNKNIAIEYNGIFWHNELNKPKNYHLEKTEACNSKGIKLIHIFEDEYVNKKDIVLNKLSHILGKCDNLPKIRGGKCEIKEISYNESSEFLEKYHIQGSVSSTKYLGAFYNDKIIGVMTFKKSKKNNWELTRFASDYNYICHGVGGKLFKYFIKNYNPNEIISFADRRWTIKEENLYVKLGFELNKTTLPDYHYQMSSLGIKRIHKFNFRKKNILKKYGEKYNLNETMTEREMCKIIGANRIYDCGLIKYVWKKEN